MSQGLIIRITKLHCLCAAVFGFCASFATVQSLAQATAAHDAHTITQLDSGSVSGGEYHNPQLGFRYQFPRGWAVGDTAGQRKAVAAETQFLWVDDTVPDKRRKSSQRCTKNLLFVSQFPAEMQTSYFNPFGLLIAADPACAPGVVFPESSKDRDAIQKLIGHLGVFIKTAGVESRGPARIRAFENGGQVMLEVSQTFTVSLHQPARTTTQVLPTSVIVMKAKDYWVMWMLVSADDTQLDQLRSSKIFFDEPSTASGQAR